MFVWPFSRSTRRRLAGGIAALVVLGTASSLLPYVGTYRPVPGLSGLVARVGNGQLAGHLSLGQVRLRLPLGLELREVALSAEACAAPLLRAQRARANVSFWPLLRGRVVLRDVWVDGLDVAAGAALTQALSPRHPGAEAPNATPLTQRWFAGLPVEVRHARITHASLLWSSPGGHLAVHDGRLWLSACGTLRQGTLSLGVDADGIDAASAGQTASTSLGPVGVQVLDVAWQPAEGGVQWAVGQFAAYAPTLTARLGGGSRPVGPHGQANTVASLSVEGAVPSAWWPLLPTTAQQLAHRVSQLGLLSLRVQARFDGAASDALQAGDGRLHATLDGPRLRVAGGRVQGATLDASLHDGHLQLEELTVRMGADQAVRAQGDVRLGGTWADPRAHAFAVAAEVAGVDVRRFGPQNNAARRRTLPRLLQGWATALGPQAWPAPEGRAQLRLQASDIDALPRGGQPVALQLHGDWSPQRARLAEATLSLGTQGVARGAASVPLAAPEAPLSAWLHARVGALTPLMKALGVPLSGHAVHAALTVGGSRAHPVAKGLLRVDALAVATERVAGPLGDVRLPWQLDGHDLQVLGATLVGEGGAARLQLRARVGTPDAHLNGAVSLDNLALPMDRHHAARASGDLLLAGSPTQPNAYGTLSWDAAEGPRGHAVRGALLAEADALAVRLTGLSAHVGKHGRLWLHGAWLPTPGTLHAVARGRALPLLSASATPSKANADATLGFDGEAHGEPSRHLVGAATVRVPRGWLQAEGGYRPPRGRRAWQQGSFDAQLRGHVALAPLAALLPEAAAYKPGGEVAVALQIGSHDHAAQGNGSLLWKQPRLMGQRLAAGDIRLQVWSPKQRQYALVVQADDQHALNASAQLAWPRHAPPSASVQLGALSAVALYPPLAAAKATLTARGRADARRDKRGQWSGNVQLTDFSTAVAGHALLLVDPAQARFAAGTLALDLLRLQGSAGRVSLRGNVGQALHVDVDGRLQLGMLLPFAPSLRHIAGEVAFDASVRGPRQAPQAHGQLMVVAPIHVQPRGMPSQWVIARGKLRLRGDDVQLSDVEGQLEGGRFALGGHLQWHGQTLGRFALALEGTRLPLHTGPIVAESNVRLRIDGDCGAPQALVKGDIDIVSGRFLRKFELRDFNFLARKPSLDVPLERRAPWLKHVALDVRAKNKDGFDVRVDAGSFAMRSTLESDVHIGGNALAPLLNGKISASEGSLRFPHGTLVLRMASLDFDPSRRSRANRFGTELNVLAEGEVAPTHAQGGQNFDITLRLDGSLDSMMLDLSNPQGLGKMDVLALLTTGHANISDLAQGGDDSAKLDAALSIAGSQVAEPMARMAEHLLERRLNMRLELGTEVSQGNVRVTAAKNLHRRLRLETAYSHGLTAEQSNVSTRAQLSFTDRLLLEGRAARDLTGASTSIGSEHSLQSNLELKLRVLGR